MSNKQKTAPVVDNTTPEQQQAALVQLQADLAAATAQNADLQQVVQGLQVEKSELMSANQELAAEVNRLKDANNQLTSELENAFELGYAQIATEQTVRATHIRVSSAHKAGQHYRAGRLWTREPVDVLKSDFTDEQLLSMQLDPMLVVVNR